VDLTELQERDLKQYVSDVESMVITTIDQRVIAILSQDLLTRARKEREMVEEVKKWHGTLPATFIDRSTPHLLPTVPIHIIREHLVDLSDCIKDKIDLHCDMLFKEQRDALKQAVSNAIANFEKDLRSYISK